MSGGGPPGTSMDSGERHGLAASDGVAGGPRGPTAPSSEVAVYWLLPAVTGAVVFALRFDPLTNDWWTNGAWLFSLVATAAAFCSRRPPFSLRAVRRTRPAPLILFLVVYAIAWIPFYDNWRWSGAGDSMPWFDQAYGTAVRGPWRSVLSVLGPWDKHTYTQTLVDNALMFAVSPTFFWHRMSKLVVNLAALSSIWVFFSLVWDRRWALAVTVLTATHFIWVILSYLSFTHTDAHFFGFAMLSAAVLVLRDAQRLSRWALAGLIAGLSGYFTQTAWIDVSACGVLLGLTALRRRRRLGLAVLFGSAVVAALPLLLQLPRMIAAQSALARPVWDWEFLYRHILYMFWLPWGSTVDRIDPNGHFFFWPVGPLYLIGIVLAAATWLPVLRRRLKLPPAAGPLLILYLIGIAGVALTGNAYAYPSWKRTFHFLPLQIFFGLLPVFAAITATRRRQSWNGLLSAATVLAVLVHAAMHVSFFVFPPERNWGNVADGLIQVRQRFGDRRTLVIDSGEYVRDVVAGENSAFNRAYSLSDTIHVAGEISASDVRAVCDGGGLLCVGTDGATAGRVEEAAAGVAQLIRVPLHWVADLRCYECMP